MSTSKRIYRTRIVSLTIMVMLSGYAAYAQKKDTLGEVEVRAGHKVSEDEKLNEFATGQKVTVIDNATLQQYKLQNLATLLTQQLPVFVKSYGLNGIATLNFRGSSAAQNQVLWNGVPIQNAALGVADISTLPVMLMNKVNVVYGGSSALWGSGNVGGALMLEDERSDFAPGKRKVALTAGAGSYGQYMGGVQTSRSWRKWYLAATIFGQTATNDFGYSDLTGKRTRMTNDKLQSASVLVQTAYKINDEQTINLSVWHQQYNREIPPALFETVSDKEQKDASLRMVADWSKQKGNDNLYAKAAFIMDDISYGDRSLLLNTKTSVYQYYQEAGWKKQISNSSRLLVFVPVQISWLPVNDTQRQTKVAAAGAYNISMLRGKLDITATARGERINDRNILLPGVGAKYAITGWLAAQANIQRSYRAPTLNELYLFPGGNAALRPEHGWSEDAGYITRLRKNRVELHHDLSVFNRDIHDWIIWLGGSIWTPHNIAEVHSRGVETENQLLYATPDWRVQLSVNTSYVLATTLSSYVQNDGSTGKQIPYTPRYNARAAVNVTYRKLTVGYNHSYTGYRFITSDESEYLLPYQAGNVQMMYTMPWHKHHLQLTGQCNNIWNVRYEVVSMRPMPGTNWLAGIRYELL